MKVVADRACFVVVLLALKVHQVELVHEAVFFEQAQRAIDRDLVERRVLSAGTLPEGQSVHVPVGVLDDLDEEPALVRHSNASRNQFLFQPATRCPRLNPHRASAALEPGSSDRAQLFWASRRYLSTERDAPVSRAGTAATKNTNPRPTRPGPDTQCEGT